MKRTIIKVGTLVFIGILSIGITEIILKEKEEPIALAIEVKQTNGTLMSERKALVSEKEKEDVVLMANVVDADLPVRTREVKESFVSIKYEDPAYVGSIVQVTGKDRDVLERLVMGESATEGIKGHALVAQCIRDTMVMTGIKTVEEVRTTYGYAGKLNKEPSQEVKDAVSFIFDQGNFVVKHRLIYFYAPKWVKNNRSDFHEKQDYIVTYGGHKFFDERGVR